MAVEGEAPPIDADAFAADAARVLAAVERADAELSVVLCDDAFIRPLNAGWRGKDQATDVLSFPQDDDDVLGDVVISVETATRQAGELGHPLDVELRALLIHGVLHLLGHDHEGDAEAARRMAAEEVRLHHALGLPATAALITRPG